MHVSSGRRQNDRCGTYDPFLIASVGFQLSYLAVLGIVYFQPKIARLWKVKNKIGNYLLGAVISQGVSSKVQLATHILTDEKVAIKIFFKEKLINTVDVERVSREIHILKLIRHPYIIQFYEVI